GSDRTRGRGVAADADSVRRLCLVQSERSRRASGHSVGQDAAMVEALFHNLQGAGEPTLHLVRHGERGYEIAAAAVGELGGGEHSAEIVARMARAFLAKIAIVEVDVAHERAVVERGAGGCGPAAADERAARRAAELVRVRAQDLHWPRAERADGAAEGVEHADLEPLARRRRHSLPGGGGAERGDLLCDRHRFLYLVDAPCSPPG